MCYGCWELLGDSFSPSQTCNFQSGLTSNNEQNSFLGFTCNVINKQNHLVMGYVVPISQIKTKALCLFTGGQSIASVSLCAWGYINMCAQEKYNSVATPHLGGERLWEALIRMLLQASIFTSMITGYSSTAIQTIPQILIGCFCQIRSLISCWGLE